MLRSVEIQPLFWRFVCLPLAGIHHPPSPKQNYINPPPRHIYTYIYIYNRHVPTCKIACECFCIVCVYARMHVRSPHYLHSLPNSGRVVPSDEHNLCSLLELLGLFLCPLFYTSLYVVNMSTIHYEIDVCTWAFHFI